MDIMFPKGVRQHEKRPSEYTFAAVFEKADGRYSVSFPQLEGCFTEGDTFEDARRMAVDAMSLHLYGMEQDGETIPKANLELQAEGGLVSADYGVDDAVQR